MNLVPNFRNGSHIPWQPHNCEDIRSLNASWFLGNSAPSGLCNQLTAVYSYISTAILLKANLVLGPLYSRLTFSDTFEDFFTKRNIELPLGSFYDFDYFLRFWRERNVSIVDTWGVSCFAMNDTLDLHRERFLSFSDEEIVRMAERSNINVPSRANALIRVYDAAPKAPFWKTSLVAFYDHRNQGENQLQRLLEVHHSLTPAPAIELSVQIITSALLRNQRYIGVHVRIESDIMSFEDLTKNMNKTVNHILNHPCLFNYHALGLEGAASTTLYLASGVFNGNFSIGETLETIYDSSRRRNAFLQALRSGGYRGRVAQKSSLETVNAHRLNGEQRQQLQLYPEQLALVDLVLLKESICFVPAAGRESRQVFFHFLFTSCPTSLTPLFPACHTWSNASNSSTSATLKAWFRSLMVDSPLGGSDVNLVCKICHISSIDTHFFIKLSLFRLPLISSNLLRTLFHINQLLRGLPFYL